MNKLRIAVLGGGVSPEHDVSLRSAQMVVEALRARDHDVLEVQIARDGGWVVAGRDPCPPLVAAHELRREVDLVFPALHGRGGEDGAVQHVLEAAGLPYALSGPRASSIGMSKALTRACFVGAGIPMPPALTPTRRESRSWDARAIVERATEIGLALPWFLKEEDCGSSLGVERVDDPAQLAAALGRVRELGEHWILEEGVDGIELTCAVLGNAGDTLTALPPVEIRPRTARFFDYAAKYDASATEELCPAPSLDAELTERVGRVACRAHDLLGCRGISRTDMMLHGDEILVLETNTIPGLTPESLLPKAARAHGLDFGDLVECLLDLALQGGRGPETPTARPDRPGRKDSGSSTAGQRAESAAESEGVHALGASARASDHGNDDRDRL